MLASRCVTAAKLRNCHADIYKTDASSKFVHARIQRRVCTYDSLENGLLSYFGRAEGTTGGVGSGGCGSGGSKCGGWLGEDG